MPRLPGPENLPRARAQRDPGLRVPDFAVGARALAQSGQAASQVGLRIGEAQLRMQQRRDALENSRNVVGFTEGTTTELERINSEADLSDPEVLKEYGSFVSNLRQQTLDNYRGSPNGRDALEARLLGIESAVTGQAAATGTVISRNLIDQAVEQSLGPLTARVREDPTPANISSVFADFDTALSDLSVGFDNPVQEDGRRRAGRERIAVNAVESRMNRGEVEAALELLDDGGLAAEVTDTIASGIRQRAANIVRARDDALRQIAQAEVIKGGPLTERERLAVIGIAPLSEELVEVGDLSSPTGSRLVPQSQAVGQPGRPRQSNLSIGSIPAGHQLVRDPSDPNIMRLEPIPGGPADVEAEGRTRAEQEQKRQTARKARVVVRDIDRSVALIDESTLPAAGPIAGSLDFPGTSAFQLQRQVDAIKSNVGFDQLQAMRAASPTGGALGAVSERENVLLQSVLGSLDIRQEPEILKENLAQIRELYLDAWFGTTAEHQAAIEDGRLTVEDVAALNEQRQSVGFDAIGRALDPAAQETQESEPAEPVSDDGDDEAQPDERQDLQGQTVRLPTPTTDLEPADILAMGREEIVLLDFLNLSPEQAAAADQRLTELGF